MHPQDTTDLVSRLRSAEGHLRSVIRQVEAEQPCEATLHQLQAVEAALQAAGRRLVCCRVQALIEELQNDPSPETRQEKLRQLVRLYQMINCGPASYQKR